MIQSNQDWKMPWNSFQFNRLIAFQYKIDCSLRHTRQHTMFDVEKMGHGGEALELSLEFEWIIVAINIGPWAESDHREHFNL